MGKSMFLMEGNLCGERVRLGRAMHKPPLTQEELALSRALHVSMDWLVGSGDPGSAWQGRKTEEISFSA